MKDATEYSQSTPRNKILQTVFFLLILFLPTQLGKHFWPDFSFVLGQRIDYLSPTLYVTDILALAFIFLSVLPDVLKKILRNKDNASKEKENNYLTFQYPYFLISFLVLLFLSLGIFFSKNPLSGWYQLLKLSEFMLLGFAVKDILDKKINRKFLIYPLVIGVFFESILGIWQFIIQSSIGGLFYYLGERTFNGETPGIANASLNGQLVLRPYATFSHPNVLAAYLLIAMTIIVYDLRKIIKNKLLSTVFLLNLFLGTIALFLTLSRIAILLWIIILGFRLIFVLKKNFRAKIKKTQLPFVLVIFLVIILSVIFLTPLHYRFFTSLDNESLTDRIYLIIAASLMIIRHPFFGIGFGNFFTELPQAFPDHMKGSVILLQPVHNIFFLIAAETGLPGLLFFLWFIFKTFRKLKYENIGLKIILISVITLGIFDHYFLTIQQGQLLLTLVLGLCWSKLEI